MNGQEVYIKFGKFHGMKGTIVEVSEGNSYEDTLYIVRVPLSNGKNGMAVKQPKNTVVVGGSL